MGHPARPLQEETIGTVSDTPTTVSLPAMAA
jgi:hypothetical protein